MSFTPRTNKYSPTDMVYYDSVNSTNKYWYSNEYNAGATADYCLPNCTTYAMGRAGEIAGKSCRNYDILNQTGFPTASLWWGNALWEKSQTPSLGAIACWTDNGNGWGGHVAVVEETDGTKANTKLSMSGYVKGSGTRSFTNPGTSANWYFQYLDFETTNYYYTTYQSRGGSFQGFLVNPYVDPTPTPPTPTETYTVTLNVSPSNGGYCTGAGEYESGTEATLTAYPNSGYDFEKWNDGYTGNPRYWTITSDLTLTAYFKKKVAQDTDIAIGNFITNKAIEVLYGKYGTGVTRKKLLGSDYNAVQYQVNYLINKYSLYDRVALQVLIGLWGNGITRKKALIKKGYNYYKVQQSVSKMQRKKVL